MASSEIADDTELETEVDVVDENDSVTFETDIEELVASEHVTTSANSEGTSNNPLPSIGHPLPTLLPITSSLRDVPKKYIDAHVLHLFASDCEDLLKEFRRMNSLSYQSFMQVWKQYHFGALAGSLRQLLARHYTGLYLFNGLWEDFINRAFSFTRRVYAMPFRIGAVYLSYNLFKLKGPLTCCRIRMRTTQEMTDLNELLHTTRNDRSCGSHLLLIVSELMRSGVFMLSPLRTPISTTYTASSDSFRKFGADGVFSLSRPVISDAASSMVDFAREVVEKPEFKQLEQANVEYNISRSAILSIDPDYDQILSMEEPAISRAGAESQVADGPTIYDFPAVAKKIALDGAN